MMNHLDKEEIHAHNVTICSDIGKISDCNYRYTAGLSRRIAETGKTIEQLTVGELLELDKAYCEWFNSLSA